MAKKKDIRKPAKKAKPVKKPVKSAVKAVTKSAVKSSAKTAAKNKSTIKHSAKKVSTAKPSKSAKPAKAASKKIEKKPLKAAVKPVAKKKVEAKKPLKPAAVAAKPGKPINAIIKGKKGAAPAPAKGGKKSKTEDGDEDVEVKDDYEKNEEEETTEDAPLEDAAMIDIEAPPASEVDDDDDEVPEKRGRGRRKKNEGKSTGGTMEAYIRNRPLQIDISKPLIKKGSAPAPKPFVNTADTRTRYSDKELAEFKELILEKLREAQADYDLLKQTLSNEDNHGTDDTSPSFKLLEDGSDVMSKEETAQLASRQEKYIIALKNALVRIENKAYGICRVTGKLIPKERLRSVPHATLGIDAKLGQS